MNAKELDECIRNEAVSSPETISLKMLSADQIAKLLNIAKSTWWRWVREDPDAPKPVLKDGNITRWRISDVKGYIEKRFRCSLESAPR